MRSIALSAVVLLCACAHSTSYVWVHDLPQQAPSSGVTGYVIGEGDVLSIRVWNQDGMSARARVRDDGKISLPFLKDVTVAGLTPDVLTEQLQKRFKDYINTPVVTVSLEESRPLTVPVLGEVVRPGSYPLPARAGVLAAVAAAGGLNEFAHRDGVYVVRAHPKPQRIRFSYLALAQGEPRAAAFEVRDGDVIVVE